MIRVAIIGSAGRGSDADKWNRDIYRAACEYMVQQIKLIQQKAKVELVSGGAAYADHIAVAIHGYHKNYNLESLSLKLFLPCPFQSISPTGPQFRAENRDGQTANYYHQQMSKKLTGNPKRSLEQLTEAIGTSTTEIVIGRGFLDRDRLLAKYLQLGDYLYAFTWSDGPKPTRGGTAHTWSLVTQPNVTKTHIPLQSLLSH